MKLSIQGFPDEVFAHPRHEAAQKALPDLIVQLRWAANVKDGYEFQQELIAHVRETEEAYNGFSKAVKWNESRQIIAAGRAGAAVWPRSLSSRDLGV